MTFVTNSPAPANPVFDYSSRDYYAIFTDILARRQVFLPQWTSESPNDFGIVFAQLLAYLGDLLGYYLDRLAGEAFLQTATQANSIINLANMLDYTPTLSLGSQVTLLFTASANAVGTVDIPAGTQVTTAGSLTQAPINFITIAAPPGSVLPSSLALTAGQQGSLLAVQGTQINNESVAISDGSINQSYPLQNSPVSANSLSLLIDIGLGPQPWTPQITLVDSGPTDQVYKSFVDANQNYWVIFGDGVNGLVPPLGSPITATYQTNVGEIGNLVGSNTITQMVTPITGLASVTNPAAAGGGSDAESLASIQANAPASLKTLNRAVTVSDIETLALQVSGVQWAAAVESTYQLVYLYIAPFGGGAPSAVVVEAVQGYLLGGGSSPSRVMANTTVTVLSPTYVAINITVNVVAYANYGNTSTSEAVISALVAFLDQNNTGFGYRISLGLVYQTILAVEGVNWATVTALYRSVLVTLTNGLALSTAYTALQVSPLPQQVNSGDVISLTSGANTQAGVVVSQLAPAGATVILVNSFTANANYPSGTDVVDPTAGVQDAVLLGNEIPVAGTFTVNVSGGIVAP